MKCGSSDPLYIILPYFNYCGFQKRRKLFLDFVKRYSNLKLVVVEVKGPAPLGRLAVYKHIKVASTSKVWIKENLINIGIKSLPEDWKFVAWIDADITFLNQNWVSETKEKLRSCDVLQMWQNAVNLGPKGEVLKIDKSFAYMYKGSKTPWTPNDKYGFWHTGFAWACTKKAYRTMDGLVDWAILGSADRHMAMSLAGLGQQTCPGNLHENYKILLKMYEVRVKKLAVDWLDGTIVHEWHGSFADRKYRERWDILTKNKFDPFEDIGYTDQGLLQLSDKGKRFEKQLEEYFIGRREDS